MESIANYFQGTNKKDSYQPATSQPIRIAQPSSTTTGQGSTKITKTEDFASSNPSSSTSSHPQQQQLHQGFYQEKCSLLEYHIQEAVLVNKALRSELKQYKDKIDFEKRLRTFLVSQAKGIDS